MRIAGRYDVEREIARGASGAVYLAQDMASSRQVALKILDPSNNHAIDLSRNEFARLSGLSHPHLVQILDIGRDGDSGSPFLAMEFVEGEPLAQALRGAEEAKALDYLIQAARALSFVHSRGLLHRDLKPANLLIRADGVLKLVDFGLAAEISPRKRAAAGTLLYLPPEVIEGEAPDPRSDLYSLGLSFYHSLTGRDPFDAAAPADLFREILQGEFPPAGGPPLPRILGAAIVRLAARKPADRFATAEDLIRHLDLASGGGLALETTETELSYLTARRMVGRSRESSRLAEALSSVSSGTPGEESRPLILVAGETGIGKSRLLIEFRRDAVLAGVETVMVSCPEAPAAPLYPFALILHALTPHAGSGSIETGQAHARLAGLLRGDLFSGEAREAPELSTAREKSRLLDQFTGYLLDRSRENPLVVILENLQWADGISLELLSYLARNARGSRLFIVASHRAENELSEEFGA